MNPSFWKGRPVFVTGHTGFKGGWLCHVLARAGARVSGYSLTPPTSPNLFEVSRVQDRLTNHVIGDIRDADALQAALQASQPEIVFHLAAQPLVRESYAQPVETFSVNVMGTVGVLEAVRHTSSVIALVNVTTDKCYENREWHWGYREDEQLGGHDPYSSSKACSELVSAAYRRSFLAERGIGVATARAGNVIGGGDWSNDRLLPDFFRATESGEPIRSRSPLAIRPWQHVLEPLSGYIRLAEEAVTNPAGAAEAWNFGPEDSDCRPVGWILDWLCDRQRGVTWKNEGGAHVHEAHFLKLDSSKARNRLGWKQRWSLPVALEMTLAWHADWRRGAEMADICDGQIERYFGSDGTVGA